VENILDSILNWRNTSANKLRWPWLSGLGNSLQNCFTQVRLLSATPILLIFLLLGCAADQQQRTPLWIRSLETLPKVDHFSRAGVFTINNKVYVQFCDPEGNQIWMRYSEEKHKWRQSRYNSLGCVDGKSSTGPNDS
jgi:hypothetical protein